MVAVWHRAPSRPAILRMPARAKPEQHSLVFPVESRQYVQRQGATLGKSGDRLTIKYKDEVLAERRLMDVS